MYSFDSTQPLGCLGGSVVRACLVSSVSWVRIPPEQLFFLFGEKRVVWVSCLSLFSIYRKEFSCISMNIIYIYVHQTHKCKEEPYIKILIPIQSQNSRYHVQSQRSVQSRILHLHHLCLLLGVESKLAESWSERHKRI